MVVGVGEREGRERGWSKRGREAHSKVAKEDVGERKVVNVGEETGMGEVEVERVLRSKVEC